eukprot:gene11494-biopygen1836
MPCRPGRPGRRPGLDRQNYRGGPTYPWARLDARGGPRGMAWEKCCMEGMGLGREQPQIPWGGGSPSKWDALTDYYFCWLPGSEGDPPRGGENPGAEGAGKKWDYYLEFKETNAERADWTRAVPFLPLDGGRDDHSPNVDFRGAVDVLFAVTSFAGPSGVSLE